MNDLCLILNDLYIQRIIFSLTFVTTNSWLVSYLVSWLVDSQS